MPKAIRVHRTGGPDVLTWEELPIGAPGPGEARVRHTAVGVNFIDTYHRSGLYKQPLPFTPGTEGAAVVLAVGEGVTELKVGDRVAYATAPVGAYSEERLVPVDKLVKVPDGVDDRTAASMMLKGLTAQYLLRQTYEVKPGDPILFHAAAGGVGLIACQWAKHLGATVIGTVGSEDKAKLARANGCDHVLLHGRDDVVARVKDLTGGRGVRVVYDGIGKDTFDRSLDCLQPRGLMVSFGQASGSVPPFDVIQLSAKGSLFLTRPTLFGYAGTRDALRAMSAELFAVVVSGKIRIHTAQSFPLRDAVAAHTALEARKTVGSTVLLP